MNKQIKCTQCGVIIDLEEALYKELKQELDKDLENKTKELTSQVGSLTKLMEKYMEEANEAKAHSIELENKLTNHNIESSLRIKAERNKVRQEAMTQLETIKAEIINESELKVKEKVDTIRQLKEQLSIAQRKADQGSMQQQGEAQEVYIEEYLKQTFPLDSIEEIKKGAMGADVVHIINTRTSLAVGSIYYESKRTKTFNLGWVDKFKKDMISRGADLGVIISSARPGKKEKATQIKGIWVCNLEEFKLISKLLREALIQVYEAKFFKENKADNMEVLYSYLTSNEFKLQVESIVEGFVQMQEDLMSEKRALQVVWNKREKQLQKVLDGTIGMYGSITGLTGKDAIEINLLELK